MCVWPVSCISEALICGLVHTLLDMLSAQDEEVLVERRDLLQRSPPLR